jgi:delta 1-pyrroline-5-carboxylate dehydrogenase
MKKLKFGNYADASNDFGPLITQAHKDKVQAYIQSAEQLCLGNKWPKVVACICIVAELQFFHFLSQLINDYNGNLLLCLMPILIT